MNQKSSNLKTQIQRSSLLKLCKLQKKISNYIQRQSTFDISRETKKTKLSAQKIPQKFITNIKSKSSLTRITTNKEFDWLTKSIQNSRQQSYSQKFPLKKSSIRQSFSNLKNIRIKTDTLIPKTKNSFSQIEFLSGCNQKTDKPKYESSHLDTLENSFLKQNLQQTSKKVFLIDQQNSLELLKQICINKRKMIKSQSFELKQFRNIPNEENSYFKQDKQNFKKVLTIEQRNKLFVKRKKVIQSQNKNERNLQQKQKSSTFLLSGFNPKESIEEDKSLNTLCDQKINTEGSEQQRTRKCIKNLKKKYTWSKDSIKHQSEYNKKRNRKIDEEIKVQPWNFMSQENEEDYEGIRIQ